MGIHIKPAVKEVANTGRVERVLKLITFLSEYRSIKEICAFLKIDRRTTHRYLNMLVQLGFVVETRATRNYGHRITNTAQYFNLNTTQNETAGQPANTAH